MCLQDIRRQYVNQGLDDDVADFLLLAWRSGTHRQYDCYLKKWVYYCKSVNINAMNPTINDVLSYMLSCYKSGLGYSGLGTLRSALSKIIKIDGKPLGQHEYVSLFLKAVFQERPVLSRKGITWEINDMLNYLRSLTPIHDLTLETLTKKTLMLMAILSGQRGQTLHALSIDSVNLFDDKVIFYINTPLKTTRPGHHNGILRFNSFPQDPDICVVVHIHEYVSRTESLRPQFLPGKDRLFFITYGTPHQDASRDSIRRWMKDFFRNAGIDPAEFSPHSTRGASTSAATLTNVPINTILRTGGWSCESTFTRHYNLTVTPACEMQNALLMRFQNRTR